MANKSLWFPLDYNILDDPKIIKLRAKYGNKGFGLYICLISLLVNNGGKYILDYEAVGLKMNESEDIVKSVINDFNLFIIEDDSFYSLRLLKHIETFQSSYEDISKTRAVSGKKGGLAKALNRKNASSLSNFFENPPKGD